MNITLTKEQAKIIATAIRPQIKVYIEANREKYEKFLKQWEFEHGEAVTES